MKNYNNEGGKKDMEVQEFDFASIAKATYNFSSYNKLREGEFGSLYKVILWNFAENKLGFLFKLTNFSRSNIGYIGREARNYS